MRRSGPFGSVERPWGTIRAAIPPYAADCAEGRAKSLACAGQNSTLKITSGPVPSSRTKNGKPHIVHLEHPGPCNDQDNTAGKRAGLDVLWKRQKRPCPASAPRRLASIVRCPRCFAVRFRNKGNEFALKAWVLPIYAVRRPQAWRG